MQNIVIKGARSHNLKNIDVTIPRDKLIVITGLSGSGKSTLAFDTIFAEGQRRYVESLSAYARQFLTRMEILDGGNGSFTPTVLETWECYGCFVTEANYNTLNYATSEPVTVSLSIQYDNAVQTPLGTGIGSTVGRTLGDVVTG